MRLSTVPQHTHTHTYTQSNVQLNTVPRVRRQPRRLSLSVSVRQMPSRRPRPVKQRRRRIGLKCRHATYRACPARWVCACVWGRNGWGALYAVLFSISKLECRRATCRACLARWVCACVWGRSGRGSSCAVLFSSSSKVRVQARHSQSMTSKERACWLRRGLCSSQSVGSWLAGTRHLQRVHRNDSYKRYPSQVEGVCA